MSQEGLRRRIEEVTGRSPRSEIRVFTDTSGFMTISYGDVIRVGGRDFFVFGEASEGRFGLDEQPKHWVKRAWDLETGERKILKLAFPESFTIDVGGVKVHCVRSPRKEARILETTSGDPHFMHGRTVEDDAGNLVRVLDRIEGESIYDRIQKMTIPHDQYFRDELPGIFASILGSVRAIAGLHEAGELHGDIRNDHLWIERGSGTWRWIDFDYAYEWTENPFGIDLLGLGNILLFATGMGFVTARNLEERLPPDRARAVDLEPGDFSLFFPNRIMNLGKLYPCIPESLNRVLMRFAHKVEVLYTDSAELVADLEACLEDLGVEEEP